MQSVPITTMLQIQVPLRRGVLDTTIPVNLWELLGGRSPPTNSSKGEILWAAFKRTKLYLVVAYICTRDRVAMLQLEICKFMAGDFLSTYLMRVFIIYWCFSFVRFSIEPTASHFNIYCLHFCLIDEWRIQPVFIIYS